MKRPVSLPRQNLPRSCLRKGAVSPRYLRLVPCLLLAGMAACAPATTPKPDASFKGNVVPEDPVSGYVTWDSQGRLDIAPPLEVLQEIRTRCQEKGYDLGYVTSISLDETMIRSAFDCRGAS
ncbi:hypothetical protein AB8880_08540 [Alphaproteobacteria bacterium LSUCC0684]